MNHIWFRDKFGIPYGFVKSEDGDVKTVYVHPKDFDQYSTLPSTEALKWKNGEWADLPRSEAIERYRANNI